MSPQISAKNLTRKRHNFTLEMVISHVSARVRFGMTRGDAARVRAKRGGLRPERSRQGNLIHFAYAWSRNRGIGSNSKQRNTSKK